MRGLHSQRISLTRINLKPIMKKLTDAASKLNTIFIIMEKVLFAVDELTGLIGAAARMRPSKSVMDMELSSLKKKFKDKKFAAGCSRDVIRQGAEMLGWTLDETLDKTIQAMRSCEAAINAEMEKL